MANLSKIQNLGTEIVKGANSKFGSMTGHKVYEIANKPIKEISSKFSQAITNYAKSALQLSSKKCKLVYSEAQKFTPENFQKKFSQEGWMERLSNFLESPVVAKEETMSRAKEWYDGTGLYCHQYIPAKGCEDFVYINGFKGKTDLLMELAKGQEEKLHALSDQSLIHGFSDIFSKKSTKKFFDSYSADAIELASHKHFAGRWVIPTLLKGGDDSIMKEYTNIMDTFQHLTDSVPKNKRVGAVWDKAVDLADNLGHVCVDNEKSLKEIEECIKTLNKQPVKTIQKYDYDITKNMIRQGQFKNRGELRTFAQSMLKDGQINKSQFNDLVKHYRKLSK